MNDLLIAPKPVNEFNAEDFHAYVTSMYNYERKSTAPVSGLTLNKNKAGKWIIRKAKTRLPYVTWTELEKLSQAYKLNQADLWNLFKARDFIIAKTRAEAEATYNQLQELPL